MNYEYQISDDGGKKWRTIATGLTASDVSKIERRLAERDLTEGTDFRFCVEGSEEIW